MSTSHVAQPANLAKMIDGVNKMFPDMKLTVRLVTPFHLLGSNSWETSPDTDIRLTGDSPIS